MIMVMVIELVMGLLGIVLKMLDGPLLLTDLLPAQLRSCFWGRGNSVSGQCDLQWEVGRPERGKESPALGGTSVGCPFDTRFMYAGDDLGISNHITVIDYIFLKYIEIRRGNISYWHR